MTNATQKQIRDHYKARNCEVRISRDGQVAYRAEGEKVWLDGRWVEEYRVDEVNGVVFA